MSRKQKLELTWIGKDERPRLEPRILLEDDAMSYRVYEDDGRAAIFENHLILGDNLLALKALEKDFLHGIKCIFIDPPYNTGAAFEHYDDGLEHSIWLSLIRDRIEIMHRLLTDDGSLWITIDDNEAHYLKVLADEIFGRRNFVASIVWEKDSGRKNDTDISSSHDYILIYAKNHDIWKKSRNFLDRTEDQTARYQNPDNDPRGPWRQGADGTAKSGGDSLRYPITLPSGRVVFPPSGNYWRFSKGTFAAALADNRVYFGRKGDSLPVIKKYLTDIQSGIVPKTWWPAAEVGSNQEARRDHLRKLLPDIEPFQTPKPERLLHRILTIATNPGDIVLDSFAGSGTTGAVAQKLGRRWIMVELGNHCLTHIIPRLRKVIDGEDKWGITPLVDWQGGGGFRFYRLAPSMLERDKYGNWIVSREYNPAMLAEAMCKHMGFTYAPAQDGAEYWNHGFSSERDFIYITTQAITHGMMAALSNDVGPDRHLLICCKAYSGKPDVFENLTVRKIPQAVLANCEWGRDDYSLRITALSGAEPTNNNDQGDDVALAEPPAAIAQKGRKRRTSAEPKEPSLFDAPAETAA